MASYNAASIITIGSTATNAGGRSSRSEWCVSGGYASAPSVASNL